MVIGIKTLANLVDVSAMTLYERTCRWFSLITVSVTLLGVAWALIYTALDVGGSTPRSVVGEPLPPVELREDIIRRFVTSRLQRAGLPSEDAVVNAVAERVLTGQAAPLPSTGIMATHYAGIAEAPLEILTSTGSNYYIKIIDWTSGKEIATAFIRGGEQFEMALPVGSYEIKYAVGQQWFGYILDFADRASYEKCDQRFDFTYDGSGYSGYTIELIMQAHGNLETATIQPQEF